MGREIARLLARDGYRVAVVGRRREPLDTLAQELDAEGVPLWVYPADIAEPGAPDRLVAQVAAELGGVQVLVNNAGRASTVLNPQYMNDEHWSGVVDVNLNAVFQLTRAVLPGMLAREEGTIVTVSSLAALTPNLLGGAAYGAAKAGVRNFMTFLHTTYRNQGLRAITILPGEADTPILDDRAHPPTSAQRANMVQPIDVARAVHLAVTLPGRVVLQEVVVAPTRQRDISYDLEVSRLVGSSADTPPAPAADRSVMPAATSFAPRPSAAVARIERASRRVQQPQSSADLVSLAMGEPNFPTPAVIYDAAEAALHRGRTHYSPLMGEDGLREALGETIGRLTAAPVDPADILITHGGTAGITAAILGIVDPGDRVVVPDPTYSLYADAVHLAGGELVPVPLQADLHWDLDALATALRGAKLFVFCNPSNPTGIVHTRAELEALGEMLRGTATVVLSDEAYSELNFTNEPFTSAIAVDALVERTLYCQTFSKSYAMTGWRVGYLWGPRPLIKAAARVHATVNGSVNTAVQDGALAALRDGGSALAQMREAYRARRELLAGELSGVPGLELSRPEGAFYLFPRYDLDLPATDVVARLREAGVAVRPGSEFGAAGEHHLRISYAADEASLRSGAARLRAGLADLRSRAGL